VADRRGRILDSLGTTVGGGGWEPDGRHLLIYEIGSQSVGRLVAVAVGGSGRFTGKPVEYLGGLLPNEMTGLALTPGGYVLGEAGQTADVWAFTISGAARRLTHSSAWYFDPVIAPDGGRVAYVKQDAWGANVYTMPFDGGVERPVTSDSGSRQLLVWLSGGQRISDLALTGGGATAFTQEVTDLGTGLRRQVTTAPGTVIIGWLPDGTALTEELAERTLARADSTGRTMRRYPLADSLGEMEGLAVAPGRSRAASAPGIRAPPPPVPRARPRAPRRPR
jgi:hypothetical protein